MNVLKSLCPRKQEKNEYKKSKIQNYPWFDTDVGQMNNMGEHKDLFHATINGVNTSVFQST